MNKTFFALSLVVCAIAQLIYSTRAIKGIPNSDFSSGRFKLVSIARKDCGATFGAKYLRRSCPLSGDGSTKLFMGGVPRQAGWWNVTLGRDASSIEVGGNRECRITPVLKQTSDCSLAMVAGRALKAWILEPVNGQPDSFTIRSKTPPQGCGKQVYLGVPDDNCKAKKVQMYAKDDGSGMQHWLMVPKGKIASPKPSKKKPQQAPGAPKTRAKYHVRVDTKTKGQSCNEWLIKAQSAYDKAAVQEASTKLKNVWSVCQVYKKKASRGATQDLLISLFVKTNNLQAAKQVQAALVKAVNNGDFAEAVKILGATGFTPKQVSLITPNCIIGFEVCKNLFGNQDLLPPMKPKKEPTGPPPVTLPPVTPTCTAGQYLDSVTTTCKACTTCGGGKYISTACSANADTICSSCSACGAGKYISKACSANADTICSPCKTCASGEYISSTCSAAANTDTTACTTCKTCTSGEYISTACSANADTVCSACTGQADCQSSDTMCSIDAEFTDKLVCTAVTDSDTHFIDDKGIVRPFNLYCSGECWSGSCGSIATLENPGSQNQWTPMLMKQPLVWSSIHNGEYSTCGLDKDKKAHCFGFNSNGNMGNSASNSGVIDIPVAVDGGHTFATLSVGERFVCGLTDPDQEIMCWGKNDAGQCGSDSAGANVLAPTKVSTSLKFKALATGYRYACAISTEASDNGYCWGDSSWGSLGNGSKTPNQSSPVKISGGHTWKMFKAGDSAICGINSADKLFCWGGKAFGVFGDGVNSSNKADGISTPLEMTIGSLTPGKTWKTVSMAGNHVCGLTLSSEVWCWGWNGAGEVSGLPQTSPATIEPPTKMTTSLSFKTIIGLWYATCGVTLNNEVHCFGNRLYAGGCGSNSCTPFNQLVPTKLPTPTGTVKDVSRIGSSTGASGWSLCIIDG